jgi:hypothetical protein
MDLRPLSLGEQLDRAVTFCVRNALVLSLIYLALCVPLTILQLSGGDDPSKMFGGMVDLLRSHKPIDPKALPGLRSGSHSGSIVFAILSLYLIVSPLVHAALITASSRIYMGSRVTFGAAYQEGVRSWLPMIGINVLYFIAFVIFCVIAFIVGFAGLFAVGSLASASHGLGTFFGIVGGGIALIVSIALMLLAWVAVNISYFTCVVERIGFVSAFARGITRAFSGVSMLRSLVAALALGAMYVGFVLVSGAGVVVIYGFLRSNIVGAAFSVATQVAIMIFVTMFFAVFYYDMRVRREGFDLQQEIAQAAPTAQ